MPGEERNDSKGRSGDSSEPADSGCSPSEVEGFLVESPPATIRVVVGSHLLEFPGEDVLEVADLRVPEGVSVSRAHPVRIKLAAGARLLRASAIDPVQQYDIAGEMPFSLAVRAQGVQVFESPNFGALEQAFAEANGLSL